MTPATHALRETSIDWHARAKEAAEAEGDEWERLQEKLSEDWKAAYRKEFVECAVRRGWKRDVAETWPSNIEDEAFLHGDEDPIAQAQEDVVECEKETCE